MQKSEQEELEELLTTRLMKQIESEDFADVKLTLENGDAFGGEVSVTTEPAKSLERLVDDTAPAQEISIAPDVLPTSFTKVEKSLASLGFFTPSSRRLKDLKSKRMSFTREVDGQ